MASYGLEGLHRVVRVQRQFLKARREKPVDPDALISALDQCRLAGLPQEGNESSEATIGRKGA